jgi:hypothetical protein
VADRPEGPFKDPLGKPSVAKGSVKGYSIAYATSDSPLGPFVKAVGYPVLKGRGVVKGAGHRFIIPNGNGYNRETCISSLHFDNEGHILPVDVFEKIKAVKYGKKKINK